MQNKRMLKHATPSNRLSINHDDLLNLPKKSYKKGKKKKADLKKKNGKTTQTTCVEGYQPLVHSHKDQYRNIFSDYQRGRQHNQLD
jgi:hypothetical protein